MFHETKSTCQESGFYIFYAGGRLESAFGGNGNVEYYLPSKIEWLYGPEPASREAALTISCEVAFARMEVSWVNKSPFNTPSNDVIASYADVRIRFAIEGERSLSLLRDMERVTGELTKK